MTQISNDIAYTEVKTFLSDETKLKFTEFYQHLSVNNAKEMLKIVQDVYTVDLNIYINACHTEGIKMGTKFCLAGICVSIVSYICKKSTVETSNTNKIADCGLLIGFGTIFIGMAIYNL